MPDRYGMAALRRAITIVDQQARKRVLLTSLRDRRRYKAVDIANCYERRWGIETSYRELKQTMLGTALTLRSKTADGVYQEIWGTLIAYNLARLEISKAALTVKCEPTEVSFIRAFHLIQFELHWAAVTRSFGKLPASMKHLRGRLVSLLNDERPGRKYDRAVKARPNRYAVRVVRKLLTERQVVWLMVPRCVKTHRISADRKPRSKTVSDSLGTSAMSCFAYNISWVL